ncbi:MAG: hypothetical protein L0Y66_03120, partial [Myxococcaceae bacterium]|nr:hypothetical protein [Myxococcaceae bacterium]
MEMRERRRALTVRHGARRRRLHLEWVHRIGPLDCVCERSVWFFARRRAWGCNCRGRERENP